MKDMIKNPKFWIVVGVVFVILVTLVLFMFLSPKNVNITFDYGNIDDMNNEVLTLKEGAKLTEPESPSRDGFLFLGWYLDDKLFDFNQVINTDIKLVAKWEEVLNDITVTFDSDNGDELNVVSIKSGSKISIPNIPLKDGYKFNNWYLEESEFDFNNPVTNSIVLKALWLEYYCETGYTLSGENCTRKVTSDIVYDCESGDTLDGNRCYNYDTPKAYPICEEEGFSPDGKICYNRDDEQMPSVCPDGYAFNDDGSCSVNYAAIKTCEVGYVFFNNTCSKTESIKASTK